MNKAVGKDARQPKDKQLIRERDVESKEGIDMEYSLNKVLTRKKIIGIVYPCGGTGQRVTNDIDIASIKREDTSKIRDMGHIKGRVKAY